uniref:Transposase n=1 Tax=Chenopodium quinoa TaxID=63459 RepID=A0A803LDI9_CHEQI
MIILHEYPLSMVEHAGFRKYSKTLQPGFKVPCRNTTKKDILHRYEAEKESISALLRKVKGRVALTTDMWTTNHQNKGYMAVTAHFFDNTWTLHSQILRFLYVPAPHTADVLANSLKECIQSWNLDLRLSSITVDNCTTNDAMMDILLGEFPYGSLMLHGQGLERIRESVSFWTASPKRVKKFEQVAKQVTRDCKKQLVLDCKTRWNSTYEMLVVAMKFREVFVVLSARDNLYKNPPLMEDWDKVVKICEILQVFNDITHQFSASKYPTANIYFPRICEIRIALTRWFTSPTTYIRNMVEVMMEKYNKYWFDVNGLMGVATILDPRFKMALIRFYFAKIYDPSDVDNEVNRIYGFLKELVEEYDNKNENSRSSSSQMYSYDISSNVGKGYMQEFAQFVSQDNSKVGLKSDLEKYLEAETIPLADDFDILNWWKTNGNNYPVLQQIAKDIMSIPVSTVPSESAFSTSGRVLDPYRSRLLPETVEALMCSQNWIWANYKGSGECIMMGGNNCDDGYDDEMDSGKSGVVHID